jgi:hypothetical protein
MMRKLFLDKLVLFSILCLMAQPLYAGTIKCWTNDEGVFECGSFIPPQYSQHGFSDYDKTGSKTKEVEAAPTPEEIAERKRQEREKLQREEQIKKDKAFLDRFASKREIERSRKADLSSIDGQFQSIESLLLIYRENLKKLEERYEKNKTLQVEKSQQKAIKREIDNMKKRIKVTEEPLEQIRKKRVETNKKYDGYIQRYRDIQLRGGVPRR